jgi:succinate dehydrogenase/fumarate reductase cytochrome b subunit
MTRNFLAASAVKQQEDTGINRKRRNRRAIVSVGLLILFILLTVSAIMIQVEEINPQSFSLHAWTVVHAFCGMIFMGFVIFHLVYNWKMFRSYLNGKNK